MLKKSCLLLLLPLFIFIPHLKAQTNDQKKGLEVYPAYKEITLEMPGETQQFDLTYINHASIPISLQMSPMDFRSDSNGLISFFDGNASNYSYSLSSFLSLEASNLDLAPGEKKSFKVTVQNRDDISPGGHYAGIIAKATLDSDRSSNILPALSSLILLRKSGGEKFAMKLTDVDWPSSRFVLNFPDRLHLSFRNEGNIHLTPYGEVVITDMFGRTLSKGIINETSNIVMPESQRRINVNMHTVSPAMPAFLGIVEVKGQDSLKKIVYNRNTSFIYINPLLIVAVALILIVVFVILKKRLYAKKS